MERSLPNTEVPGIKSAHAMITDACRAKPSIYDPAAFEDAVEELRKAYIDVMIAREKNGCADRTTFHLVLSVEDLRHEPNQETALRVYVGGVRRKTDELTTKEAVSLRHDATILASYLTGQYKLIVTDLPESTF